MNFKNITVGKKISYGFGTVLLLLIAAGLLSYFGVDTIVKNAGEVIDGNKLDGNLAQKEVDHLNWANRVNALLTNDKVTVLDVQTDDHKCAFGKWLYGEGRDHAEILVPSLKPLLKKIETPHHELHKSATEIGNVFKQPHTGLATTLSNRLNDHINWVAQLGESLAFEAGGLYSYQARLKSAVQQAFSVLQVSDRAEKGDIKTRQHFAGQIIEALRYGNQGKDYFFIIDENARMVMHPFKPELNGKDVSGSQDPGGKRLFTEMTQVCKSKGEGFVTYQWPLPETTQLAPKLSYVKMYKPWGWIVGTGVYLDHNNHALLKRADEFSEGKPFSTGLQLDPTQCAFGRFLAAQETKDLVGTFPEFKTAIDTIVEPHKHLHLSAVKIEDRINQLEMEVAMRIFNEETKEALNKVKAGFNDAIEAENKLMVGANAANQVYAEKTIPSLTRVQELLSGIRKEAREHIMTDTVMLNAAQRTQRNVVVVACFSIVVGILLAFFISKGIINALQKIATHMEEGAGQVASASDQVSSSSQELAEGASEQAAAIEETSSSLEEMASMTRQNADNAGQADNLMKEAKQVVGQANESMTELIASMEDIAKASENTSKIIKTIDEIAFQTNLLALNAAVEAARAGEAGAGFAVVADEVRSLAMRAAEAAKNTADLIEGTVKKVGAGSELVSKTNDDFTRVADGVLKVGELVGEIAAASNEQSQGIEQTNNAVADMEKVVQQNAANAEESASASEELSAQAEQMKATVGQLLAMVGGGNTDGHLSTKEGLEAIADRTQVNQPLPIGQSRQDAMTLSKKENPEVVIPMNDGDFKDF